MRILIDTMHPAHVHFFKNMVWNLQKKGHEILITVNRKDVNLDLLNAYGLPYKKVGANRGSLLQNLLVSPARLLELYRVTREFKPDLLCGIGNPFFTFVGKILGKPTIVFDDTEFNPIVNLPTFFLATVVCTPFGFKKDLGKKQIRCNCYKELAYLHPNHFKPDSSVLDLLGVKKDEKFVIMRYVAFKAPHDIQIRGFTRGNKIKAAERLSKYAKVFMSFEGEIPQELDKYRLNIPPEKLHDVLHYASLYLGDSQTTTTEAACLGTPAIRCNTFARSSKERTNFIELEEKYGLIFNFNVHDQEKSIEKAIHLLQKENLKEEWREKRQKLLDEKIDVTAFMVWLIENYPENIKIMKNHPDYQRRFK